MSQIDLFAEYPDVPGWKARDTAKKAAESVAPVQGPLQRACLACLRDHGPQTADEIAERLREGVLTIRPRISELAILALIEDSGSRHPNASGRQAIVWKLRS